MWEIFVHPSNIFFSVSLCLMLLLGLVEALLLIAGATTQGFLDQFIPDQLFEAQHPDLNLESNPSIFVQILDWLYIGRIPVLVWLIIFLTTFGLFGLITQGLFFHFTESYFPLWIIAPDDETIDAKWRGIGIRIEDDIVATKNGPLNLTSKVVKTIEDIEALMAS